MLNLQDASLLKQQCLIDGAWCDADDGATIAVTNPATGEVIATVPRMGAAETRRAIAASHAAFRLWRKQTVKARATVLRAWHALILQHADDLALILTTEQGKSLAEAKGEIVSNAAYLEWFAEEGKRAYGDVIAPPSNDKRIVVIKQPIGVCAAITPWNFPNGMITRKAGPALAAGCSMVLKPASQTPLSALALGELALRAGVPPGVFNVVTGAAQAIGTELCHNDLVRKITFTGSTEVGAWLSREAAGTIKKLSLELGGNAPFIVFEDADIDAAVEGVLMSKYRNSGQTCVCANRIYVQDSIYDDFAARLVAKVAELKLGNGLDAGVTQGPLIDENAVRKIEQHIADALAKGGKLAIGGKRHALGGSFFEPSVVLEANSDMLVATEETFAPLAPLFRFGSEEEVVAMANATQFGLAGYFYSRDLGRVWRVAEELEVGMVGINTGMIANEMAPFGGVKHSGMGREGSHYGMDDFLDIKYLCMGGI
ncbi:MULTISPECIES: NAD-dependent succinate-semialdehyde dehydrogenase [unclassified Janthinobacterium]|uniref:NAD-dependent succinate-semialdehyde dehydrogenase n=1 Tax=unclassified Janthinobacterium TaxID=2610881 RepID=UPI0025B3D5E8|nr:MULTISPECIES: NAD-dependent succinate-semialdehyde dehydrogenase [unclassified Janthinobacterium]MDN2701470.1 NAD-dependent succinate-semialdehyde dehydrogenase [Janthinobacterium sp. SUN100]MDN2713515.1 NAD-dependent succinate-semialdehyde dehydrogenase [Janthinobacterium sp. SUN120]MDO8039229.1 NAD-dependent succinate-semialdehyde dehydrogenase [Janthinobacterium sp. SUN137]MDO8047954.1 NAD-dependent succinate-semialdehyde dehydrogenase [Janthinobacterium sp. SUN211]